MKTALVCNQPLSIVRIYEGVPERIDIGAAQQVYGVSVGWVSGDGMYDLRAVEEFVLPEGQRMTGGALYSIVDERVVETYPTEAIPAPPVSPPSTIVRGLDFLARLTDAEYGAILAAASQSVQLARWIDMLRLEGQIDVAGAAAVAARAAVVQAGLLSADRAAVIFAPPVAA